MLVNSKNININTFFRDCSCVSLYCVTLESSKLRIFFSLYLLKRSESLITSESHKAQ